MIGEDGPKMAIKRCNNTTQTHASSGVPRRSDIDTDVILIEYDHWHYVYHFIVCHT